MNFLAHLYLSKDNKNVLIGNFIADAVKGKQYLEYPLEVQYGIQLHRAIDSFTDTHPIVKTSMRRLNPRYKHYDGVIIDILYDHFLAKNWCYYSDIPLDLYAAEVYAFLDSRKSDLPEKIQYMLPYMIEYNWLVAYASVDGIANVLKGMNRRTNGISKMDRAAEDLVNNYKELEEDFTLYFKELEDYSKNKLIQLKYK